MPTIFILPFPPSTNALYPGKSRRYKSEAYVSWELAAREELRRQRVQPVKGQVVISYEFQEPQTKRKSDVGNREKAATDLLVSAGIIAGDDQFTVREINLKWSSDPGVIGVRVTITPVAEAAFKQASAA